MTELQDPADDLDIAVIGVGCRFPDAHGPDAYWINLLAGTESIRLLGEDVLARAGVPAAEYRDPSYVRAASRLADVDRFDASFFGYSPREAELLDPQVRVFLECAWEALEHAGHDPSLHAAPVGVFVAASPTTYLLTSLRGSFDPKRFTLAPGNLQHYLGNASEFIATRVSYKLNLRGPSLSVQSACSGSLVAVHLARQSLLSGESSVALAGGVSIYLPQDVGYQHRDGLILSPAGTCRPFDEQAAGTVFGRGAGVVVLKRLADALADRDHVYTVVKGSAINNDGSNKVGFTAPSVSGQADVIAEALANAGVTADTIGYVEAHGTATAQGDPIEIAGLTQAFGETTGRRQFCAIGSVKGNIGHLDAAAGMAGLIKTVLALDRECLPASLHYGRPNPVIDFAKTPFFVNDVATPWTRSSRPRRAGVSAFGMGGTNAHVVIEEAPAAEARAAAGRDTYVLTLSGKTPDAVRELAARYAAHVAHGDASLADVCFTATTGRAAMAHRVAIITRSREELVGQLEAVAAGRTAPGVVQGEVRGAARPRVAFAFTGQGAQYAGMARELFETQPVFRGALEACATGLARELERSLLEVLYGDGGAAIDETAYAQPALFAVEYALARMWASWGVEPGAVLGHSIGEYAAAVVAGALSLDDALRLVAARGRLLQALPRTGAMTAVLAPAAAVEAAIAKEPGVGLAAVNAADAVVIAGPIAGVETVEARLRAAGVELQRLTVSHAFHSTLVEPMLGEWQAAAARVRWQPPPTPIVSGLTGRVASAAELANAGYWRRQVREPVQFAAGVATLAAEGYDTVVEIGPQPTLTALARRGGPGTSMWWGGALRRGRSAWHGVLTGVSELWVRGVPVNWAAVADGTGARRVALPTYPFQRTRFWIDAPNEPAASASAAGEIGARAREARTASPFSGRRLSSPAITDRVFEFELSHDGPAFLDDHRICGTPVLPMTGFVELALRTADHGSAPAAIEALQLVRALPLAEGERRIVHVIVRDADGRDVFEIHSARAAESDAAPVWSLHATGALRRTTPVVEALDLDAIRARCGERTTGAAYYDALHRDGLEYGPAFQGIGESWHREGEALARLATPADVVAEAPGYRAHPAILDAALQAAYVAFPGGLRTSDVIFLPASVDGLQVAGDIATAVWSHLIVTPAGDPSRVTVSVRLADANGHVVAALDRLVMQGAPRRIFESASDVPEWCYAIQWRPQSPASPGTLEAWPPAAAVVAPAAADVDRARIEYGADVYDTLEPHLDALSREYVCEALHALGWSGSPQRFTTAGAAVRLGVLPRYLRMLDRMFEMLAEDGLLVRDADGWREVRVDGGERAAARLEALLATYPTCRAELTVLGRCGAGLAAVLRGAQDPLELLFPGGSLADLEALYTTSSFARAFNALVRRTVESVVGRLPAGRTLRIVEVGAGTGGTASWVLPVLPRGQAEYTFTDVSNLFLSRARQRFQQYDSVHYRLLDMELEPAAQGFEPGGYDVVLATNVLHATEDLGRTVSRAKSLLAPGGLLVLVEATARQRWVDVIFGLTDGWWKFTDTALRPSYPLLSIPQWRVLLDRLGFEGVSVVPSEDRAGALCHQAVIVASAGLAVADAPRLVVHEHWLVVGAADGSGVDDASMTAAALTDGGARCDVLRPPAGADRAWYARALSSVVLEERAGRHVVDLRGLDATAAAPGDDRALLEFQRRVAGGALHLVQALLGDARWQTADLTMVTRGAQAVGEAVADDGVASASQAASATLWGFGRTLALEHPELRNRRIDLDPAAAFDPNALAAELHERATEDEVGFRGGRRYVARIAPGRLASAAARASDTMRLDVDTPGLLETLALRPAGHRAPRADEVEVEVEVAGLNFKDVLIAMGALPRLNALGLECAGRVTRVGAAVTGMAPGDEVVVMAPGCFGTAITVPAHAVAKRPAGLTSEQAATVPVAFVTAAHALESVARLRAGDRVLIHAATGAVGMAAMQIARRAGAEILATAGSDAKRAWLRAAGVEHVMDSRSLAFADEIRALTGGRGVDVVLNSLAGEFVAAGLSVLAPGGRFVELGKTTLLSESETAGLLDGRRYYAVDVNAEYDAHPRAFAELLARVMDDCATGALVPLPSRTFAAAEADEAFRFMAQARHQGKLLIRFGRPRGAADIRRDATYVITGAYGGLGLLVAQWLVERGATALALVGRHAPAGVAEEAVAALRRAGVQVPTFTGDVGVRADVERVFGELATSMPPVAGVFHAAGTVEDRVILQQDWPRFERVFAAKVQGAWHLHAITKDLPLDHFVLFSTSMSVLGSAGQANHSAANAYMDALASARRASGLVGVSISWGPWSDVGAAVTLNVTGRLAAQGLRSISPAAGLAALEAVMASAGAGGPAHAGVMPMDWPAYFAHSPARDLGRFAEIRARWASEALRGGTGALAAGAGAVASGADIARQVGDAAASERPRILLSWVRDIVARSLGMSDTGGVDPASPLAEFGLDSLLAVEVRSVLGSALGRSLPASLLFDYPTLDGMTGYLGREVLAIDPWLEQAAAPVAAPDALASIEQMDDDEVERLLAGRLGSGGARAETVR